MGLFIVVSVVLVYEGIECASRWRFNASWWRIGIALVLVSTVLGFICAIKGLGPSLLTMAIAIMPLIRLGSLLRKKTDTNLDLEYAYGILLLNLAPICVIVFITASLCAAASVCYHFNVFPS